jgi:hypothetical protein
MKILNSNRLYRKTTLPILIEQGHDRVLRKRYKSFFCSYSFKDKVTVEVDFLKEDTLGEIPNDIDAAYYLIHSMSSSADNYDKLRKRQH